MKKCLLMILVLFIFSCNDKKQGNITCESQRKKAKRDLKNNQFTYFEHIDLLDNNDNNDLKNFAILMKENNIKVVFDTLRFASCLPNSETDPNNLECYKEMMNNNLHAKFGHQFFDSLRLKSKK
ncbi:hypothetical protein NZ698_07210 [Chryseobacterium sp. PBS4-4]|uniref:Lipoprotein n=1 Tax=Chryseobacterium edaphi TaxID=2976532 RepID=A0ABT2W434_9FLAO|nr:hypothetical protein [Chryseobacterium edaphi]MCU7616981.1 hypothetical protein [Chryseobacterium edaphi]